MFNFNQACTINKAGHLEAGCNVLLHAVLDRAKVAS